MKAGDLRLDELVIFDKESLSLCGRRVELHDSHSFAQLRRDLFDMVGVDATRRIMTRFGFAWGQADAGAMKRVFEWDSLQELLRAGPALQTLQGVTRTRVRSFHMGSDGSLAMDVEWFNDEIGVERSLTHETHDHSVCWVLCGYLSGFSSFCLGRQVLFVEVACQANGDRVCRTIGRDRVSWGPEIEDSLRFFETEDIQAKIANLTEKLRRRTHELERQKRRFRELEGSAPPDMAEIGSASFRRTLDLASRVARFDSSILITGESGVGKEVIARYIHKNSQRAMGPFVAVNCGALPETLLESELFGHRSGSFTGAVRDRKGLFEQANGGTIFLDEIGEISLALQVNLLRVLQEREIRRIGENVPRPIDVRIIAASNQDLERDIKSGTFRDDLYYRLSVVEVHIPPLRSRPEDILPAARFIVTKLARKLDMPHLRFDADCIDVLQRYSWPGNVRELENALERAAVLSENGRISKSGLPACVLEAGVSGNAVQPVPTRSLKDVEAAHIRSVLRHTGGNRAEAARILGIGVTTLWRRLKTIDFEPTP